MTRRIHRDPTDYYKDFRVWVSLEGSLNNDTFATFEAALAFAIHHQGDYRIHFDLPSGERIRLVKDSEGTFRIVEDFQII